MFLSKIFPRNGNFFLFDLLKFKKLRSIYLLIITVKKL